MKPFNPQNMNDQNQNSASDFTKNILSNLHNELRSLKTNDQSPVFKPAIYRPGANPSLVQNSVNQNNESDQENKSPISKTSGLTYEAPVSSPKPSDIRKAYNNSGNVSPLSTRFRRTGPNAIINRPSIFSRLQNHVENLEKEEFQNKIDVENPINSQPKNFKETEKDKKETEQDEAFPPPPKFDQPPTTSKSLHRTNWTPPISNYKPVQSVKPPSKSASSNSSGSIYNSPKSEKSKKPYIAPWSQTSTNNVNAGANRFTKDQIDSSNQNDPNIKFNDKKIIKAGQLSIHGVGISSAIVGQESTFTIDLSTSGPGQLGIGMMGPSDTGIKMESLPGDKCKITYKPQEPGTYHINIKFADKEISGSPFKILVRDADNGFQNLNSGQNNQHPIQNNNSSKSCQQTGQAKIAHVNTPCHFNLKIDGLENPTINIKSELTNSYTTSEPIKTKFNNPINDTYTVSFTPKLIGKHILKILYKNMHISGSPFTIIVEEEKLGKAELVTATGGGLISSKINQESVIKVDTSKANGSGSMSVDMGGPSQPRINFRGEDEIIYCVSKEGTYVLNLKFNGDHVQGSPFSIRVGR